MFDGLTLKLEKTVGDGDDAVVLTVQHALTLTDLDAIAPGVLGHALVTVYRDMRASLDDAAAEVQA